MNKFNCIMSTLENGIETAAKSKSETNLHSLISKLSVTEGKKELRVPEFSCHQNQEELIFVLQVANLCRSSVRINYNADDEGCFCIAFCGPNSDYSLFLKFLPECRLQPEKETLTVSETNAVLILNKHPDSQHYWEYFSFGLNFDQLTQQHVLTVSALQHKLDILQRESSNSLDSDSCEPETKVEVVYVDEERIEIQFGEPEVVEGAKASQSESEQICDHSSKEDSSNSSASGAENYDETFNNSSSTYARSQGYRRFRSVSESSGTVTLRGILKHGRRRNLSGTLSESSDDFSWSSQDFPGLDSDIPEEEENSANMKKSVHFNDNVYRSFFRSNSSILGQREKNRRKQRKKQELRRRRSSEGDSSSSGIEVDFSNNNNKLKIDFDNNNEAVLDINQNQASVQNLSQMLDLENKYDRKLSNAELCCHHEANCKAKHEEKKRRRKKKQSNNGVVNGNKAEDMDVSSSSAVCTQFQRPRRYFSRKRQTSV